MKLPGSPPKAGFFSPDLAAPTPHPDLVGGEATDPEVPLQGSRAPLRNASCNDSPRVDHWPFLEWNAEGLERLLDKGEPWETEPGQRKALSPVGNTHPHLLLHPNQQPGIHHAPLSHFPLPRGTVCTEGRHPVIQGCWGEAARGLFPSIPWHQINRAAPPLPSPLPGLQPRRGSRHRL